MAAASHPLTSKPLSQKPLVRSLQSLSLKDSYEKSLIPFFKAISNQVPKAKQLLDRISKSSEDQQAQKITQWFDENGAMLSLVTQKPAMNFKEYPCSYAAKLIKLRFMDFKHIWTEDLKALVQKRASFFEYIKGEGIFDLSSFFYSVTDFAEPLPCIRIKHLFRKSIYFYFYDAFSSFCFVKACRKVSQKINQDGSACSGLLF